MSRETLANLRRGYEALNRGDASAAMDLATPDVEWGTTGTFPGLVGGVPRPGGDSEVDGHHTVGLGEVRGNAR
jgi:ketosteroid isomerase-like protein